MLANVSVLKIAVLAAAEVINLRAYTYYIRDGAARRDGTGRKKHDRKHDNICECDRSWN